MFTISGEKNKLEDGCVNIKFLKVWKSNKLKSVPQIYFCINQVVSISSVSIFLQKNILLTLSSLNLTWIINSLGFGWKMNWTIFTTNL